MNVAIGIVAALVGAYFLGAVPFALIVGKCVFGTDVREHGSGNLGTTNVWRVLGWKAGLLVFVCDVAKGALAVGVVALLYPKGMSATARDWTMVVAALAATVGHSYSPYIRLRGGKGVATAAGALLVISPLVWAILFTTFLVIIFSTRMVSLGSILIAMEFPLVTLYFYRDRPAILTLSFAACAFVILRHKGNIRRIFRGEEAKMTLAGKLPDGGEGTR